MDANEALAILRPEESGNAFEPDDAADENAVATEAAPEPAPEPTPQQRAAADRARREDGTFDKDKKPKGPKPKPLVDDLEIDPQLVDPGDAEPDPDAAAEPEPAAPAEAQPAPYTFIANGQEIALPGALLKPGVGVFIPEGDALEQMRIGMARGARLAHQQQRNAELRSQLERGYTRVGAEAAALSQMFAPFLDPEKGLDAWRAAANDPLIVDRLRLKVQQAQQQIESQYKDSGAPLVDAPKAGEPPAELVQEIQGNLSDTFERALRKAWPDAAPADRQQLEQEIARTAQAYLERASADDPLGRWSKGGIAINQARMETMIRGARAGHTPPAAAAPTPAAALPPKPAIPAKVVAPPTGGGAARNLAGGGKGRPPTGDKPFTSKNDVRKWLDEKTV